MTDWSWNKNKRKKEGTKKNQKMTSRSEVFFLVILGFVVIHLGKP